MKLFVIASRDNVISDEEGVLIMGIKHDLATYLKAVEKAEKEGITTSDETLKLNELLKTVVLNAEIIAAKDYNISNDEKMIISKLIEILKSGLY